MTRTIGVILAGGKSSRMGADKATILLAGQPLIAHVMARLMPQVDTVAIVANSEPERFKSYRCPVIADSIAGFPGPLAGVHAAALHFPDDDLVTVAVDLPFLPRNLVAHLRAANRDASCTYATCGDRHALAILWAPGQAESVAAFLAAGGRRITEWLDANGKPVVILPAPFEDQRFNINTPGDLACAEQCIVTGNWEICNS